MKLELPVVGSCADEPCGACCLHVGVPLGFGAFCLDAATAAAYPDWMHGTDDHAYWLALPEAARALLTRYYADLRGGRTQDRCEAELPCLFLDMGSRRCRHYGQRPLVCREALEPGDDDCQRLRADMLPRYQGVTADATAPPPTPAEETP